MPRKSTSGTRGLRKIHDRECRNRRSTRARPTACACPWLHGRYQSLARCRMAQDACGETVDPHELGPARIVFARVVHAAIDATGASTRPGGETRTSGTTFKEYIEEWWKDELDRKQRPRQARLLHRVVNVIATSVARPGRRCTT